MLSSEEVYITQIPGKWIGEECIVAPVDSTSENSYIVFNRLKPVPSKVDGDSIPIIEPVMPAIPPTFNFNDVKPGFAPVKGDSLKYGNTLYKGYRSGRRSAVVPVRKSKEGEWNICVIDNINYTPDFENPEKYIRLKGCGMWIKSDPCDIPGFTLQEALSCHSEEKVFEVCGCAFPATAATELYASSKINTSLQRIGFIGGNTPIGLWLYDKDLHGDPAPNIQKAVLVMETVGDRRLETHLLAGLEKILINNCEHEHEVVEAIKAVYEKYGNSAPSEENSKLAYVKSTKLDRMQIFNIYDKQLNSLEPLNAKFAQPDELIKEGYVPPSEIIEALDKFKFMDSTLGNFARLYQRIGNEVGRTLAGVHRAGFVWGTYCDHDLNELHCNSHPDNLVILDAKTSIEKHALLAAVDFDMSFEARTAVNFWMGDQPKKDPTMVTENMHAEHQNMMSDLLGLSAMFAGMSTAIGQRQRAKGDVAVILEAVRDLCGYEYVRAYDNPLEDVLYNFNDRYIIEEALNATIDQQS